MINDTHLNFSFCPLSSRHDNVPTTDTGTSLGLVKSAKATRCVRTSSLRYPSPSVGLVEGRTKAGNACAEAARREAISTALCPWSEQFLHLRGDAGQLQEPSDKFRVALPSTFSRSAVVTSWMAYRGESWDELSQQRWIETERYSRSRNTGRELFLQLALDDRICDSLSDSSA